MQRRLPVFATLAVVVLVAATLARHLSDTELHASSDFLGAWCAGRLLGRGIDPYLAGPLLACELGVQAQLGAFHYRTVMPSPYPPPTTLLFSGFAAFAFLPASRVFAVAETAAFAGAVWAMARTIALPSWALAVCLAFADFADNVSALSWVPVEFAVVTCVAAALRVGRPGLAGLLAPLALLQPSIGLPVIVSLVLAAPRARFPVAAGVALFALLGFVAGIPLETEFFGRVLPSQAAGELVFDGQYSLTWLLWLLGAPEAAALRAGSIQYALLVLAAVLIARPAARALHNDAALAYVPMAAAVTLGTYVHSNYIVFAVPLALLLAMSDRAPTRVLAWAAVLILTLPVTAKTPLVALVEAALVATAVTYALPNADRERRFRAILLTLVAASLLVAIPSVVPRTPLRRPAVATYLASGVDLSLASARRGLDDRLTHTFEESSARILAAKTIAWSGLVLVLGMTAATARRRVPLGAGAI